MSDTNQKTELDDLLSFDTRVRMEMRALAERPPLVIALPPALAFMVISQCQLAFRHPQNVGPVRDQVGRFLEELAQQLAAPGSSLDQIIKMGYDSRHDVGEPGDRSCGEGFRT